MSGMSEEMIFPFGFIAFPSYFLARCDIMLQMIENFFDSFVGLGTFHAFVVHVGGKVL